MSTISNTYSADDEYEIRDLLNNLEDLYADHYQAIRNIKEFTASLKEEFANGTDFSGTHLGKNTTDQILRYLSIKPNYYTTAAIINSAHQLSAPKIKTDTELHREMLLSRPLKDEK